MDRQPATQQTAEAALDALADELLSLIHGLSSASRQLRRRLTEAGESFGLTDQDVLLLWLCRGSGRVQVELAASLGVSPAQMSGAVERLRQRSLLAMRRSTLDRRRQVWRTTDDGVALLVATAMPLGQFRERLESHLPAQGLRTAQQLCAAVSEAASEPAPNGAEHHAEPSTREAA